MFALVTLSLHQSAAEQRWQRTVAGVDTERGLVRRGDGFGATDASATRGPRASSIGDAPLEVPSEVRLRF
jgi:hypothetical protein